MLLWSAGGVWELGGMTLLWPASGVRMLGATLASGGMMGVSTPGGFGIPDEVTELGSGRLPSGDKLTGSTMVPDGDNRLGGVESFGAGRVLSGVSMLCCVRLPCEGKYAAGAKTLGGDKRCGGVKCTAGGKLPSAGRPTGGIWPGAVPSNGPWGGSWRLLGCGSTDPSKARSGEMARSGGGAGRLPSFSGGKGFCSDSFPSLSELAVLSSGCTSLKFTCNA